MKLYETGSWVLWGFCDWNPTPIKLSITDFRAARINQRYREAQGWTCAIYELGTEPVGLRLQAKQVSGS